MPNEEPPVPLFRAYIRRKPSGLLLVTVLSTLLPRPLFRMYPAELGEVAAVERSILHALDTLHQRTHNESEQRDKRGFNAVLAAPNETAENDADKSGRKSQALLPTVNVVSAQPLNGALPSGPDHESCNADKREEQHACEGHSQLKPLCIGQEGHGSPHVVHQRSQHAAVSSAEQEGADGYAVKDGHLVASGLSKAVEEVPSPHCPPEGMRWVMVADKKRCVVEEHRAAEQRDNDPYELKKQPTQHRCLVVWQKLLPFAEEQPSCAVGCDIQTATA